MRGFDNFTDEGVTAVYAYPVGGLLQEKRVLFNAHPAREGILQKGEIVQKLGGQGVRLR